MHNCTDNLKTEWIQNRSEFNDQFLTSLLLKKYGFHDAIKY